MVKRKTIWVAEIEEEDNPTFDTKKEATDEENKYKQKKEIEKLAPIFRKYFKTYYKGKEYESYVHFCVDCGKKLLEYDYYYDGHRNERGDCIYRDPEFKTLFDGSRCGKCHEKIIKLFEKMMQFHMEKTNKILIIDTNLWVWTSRKNHENIINLFKIIEFYDKNKKSRH